MIITKINSLVLLTLLSTPVISNAFELSGDFNTMPESTNSSSQLIQKFPDSSDTSYQYVYLGNDADGTPLNPTIYAGYYPTPAPTVRLASEYTLIPDDHYQISGYRYFTAAFKTPGLYTMSVTQGDRDPVSAIYVARNSSSAYSSSNPLTNLYAFNDDSGGESGTGPWNIYYNQTGNECTFVQFLLYEYGDSGSGLTGQYSISGPGSVASSCARLGPPLADTQASLERTTSALRSVYASQSAAINMNLNNDCTLFDKHGVCTSVTGTQTYVGGGLENNTTNGTLTVAYRVNDKIRVGGYLDQTLNTSNNHGVNLSNGSPAFGAFAVWNANANGLGPQVRVSAGYADKDLSITRQVIGSSEAGSGKTGLDTLGVALVGSYAVALKHNVTLSPYIGIRYTKINADGYTETALESVTAPLTYSELSQGLTTAMLGTKLSKPLGQKTVAYASFGVEQDLHHKDGTYAATGIDGLTPIAFSGDTNSTRATASVGTYYNIGERQRIAANLMWSEQNFTSVNTTSLMATYTHGF